MFFDRRRDRVFTLGSAAGDPLQLWETSAEGAPEWHGHDLVGESPYGYTTLAYDEHGDRLLAFSDDYPGAPSSMDVFELPLATLEWRRFDYEGPAPYAFGSAFYDEQRDCAWFYWRGDSLYRADFEGQRVHVIGMAIENGSPDFFTAPLFFDPAGSRIVGFRVSRHNYRSSIFDDLVVLDIGPHLEWERQRTTGRAPASRYQHSIVYDEARRRIIIFGGYDDGWLYFDNILRAVAARNGPRESVGEGLAGRRHAGRWPGALRTARGRLWQRRDGCVGRQIRACRRRPRPPRRHRCRGPARGLAPSECNG